MTTLLARPLFFGAAFLAGASSFFWEPCEPWLAFGGPPPKKLRMSAGMLTAQAYSVRKPGARFSRCDKVESAMGCGVGVGWRGLRLLWLMGGPLDMDVTRSLATWKAPTRCLHTKKLKWFSAVPQRAATPLGAFPELQCADVHDAASHYTTTTTSPCRRRGYR